jgi:hypothetical protein
MTKLLVFAVGAALGSTLGLMLGSWLSRNAELDEVRQRHIDIVEQHGRDRLALDEALRRGPGP